MHCVTLILGFTTEVASWASLGGSTYNWATPENSRIDIGSRVVQRDRGHMLHRMLQNLLKISFFLEFFTSSLYTHLGHYNLRE